MRQAHREDRLPRLHEGAVGRDVRARTAVRLEVGVVGAEECLGALDAQGFGLVDDLAAAVVATARIALGVLVGQRRSQRGQDGRRGEVLTRDELEAVVETVTLIEQDAGDVGIHGLERSEVGAPGRGGGGHAESLGVGPRRGGHRAQPAVSLTCRVSRQAST